jgi:translation initiation factor IF-1
MKLFDRYMPKRGRGSGTKRSHETSRSIKDIACDNNEGQSYGKIIKDEGNRRFRTQVGFGENQREMVCSIRGAFRKRVTVDSYVLVQIYEFNHNQAQIMDVYSDKEIDQLRIVGLFPNEAEMMQSKDEEVETVPVVTKEEEPLVMLAEEDIDAI